MRKNLCGNMREFILLASKAVTKPFSLNDLPGAGRIDLIARCVADAVFISEAIRPDVIFYVILNGPPNPPVMVSFDTRYLKRVSPDERNIASHINIALKKISELNFGEQLISEPGIMVARKSFEQLIKEKHAAGYQLIYLHKKGVDIRKFAFKERFCIILGDHRGLPKKTEKFLKNLGVERVSVGPLEYLSSQCITIVHNILDI